ncbi:preprotein translocase subunit YajC [Microbacterium marinilacus]|uniref:Preprotein translocase subunit YajC n=1 Tax=Microbacterium marinilacus TaxID=415209 RepID=A0ABP7B1Q7_9MICO|nr:preprotein translocase subunit YajC [Microbacterium marinilacus]MBY0688758.1 preprotein translocase subunit YajC [Microbacterium marinilacus]
MDPNILLLVVLVALLVWMFFSSRRRQQKMRDEQALKAEKLVPGARVMTRSGLFGTLVAYDKDDLSQPAKVEIADGVVVELHTQAVDLAPEGTAPVVDETDETEVIEEDVRADEAADAVAETPGTYTVNGIETDELPGAGKGDDKKD